MEIHDLRPMRVRLITGWWERGEAAAPVAGGADRWSGTRIWNTLAQVLVEGRVRRRAQPPASPFVVSVGNLAVGGTGKTPVVAALARDLQTSGLRVTVVTRGYGSPLPGPRVVEPGDPAAGDEARWLAGKLEGSGCPVVQARDRASGMATVRGGGGVTGGDALRAPDVVILEDGHQSAAVGRHLDVLILDRWTAEERTSARAAAQGARGPTHIVPRTGAVLPWGPWRESAQGARRADIWLLETIDPVPGQGLWGNRTATFARAGRLAADPGIEPEAWRGRPWAALSGIARPGPFEAAAADLMGRPADLAIRCADHQRYDDALLLRIARTIRQGRAACVVTTEKDWVKLRGRWPAEVPVLRVAQELTWGRAEALPVLVRERWRQHVGGG